MSAAIFRGAVVKGKAETSVMFAAFDDAVHHVDPGVRPSKFSALLAPFATSSEAQKALFDAGCNIVGEVGR